ncbi:asparagine synthase-related protein [Litoreibacter janthinus]|uniref:Asparagine synthase n=1 Tax=Litoreibacter janthinus TaxID=670154 RepID=A0A1I6HUZ8_9RHOB|nr:asparagine synthase-related protein [Litoreibacter janthinus]SFR58238.1 Asparagine synthase [Litoreibacter janthinus]
MLTAPLAAHLACDEAKLDFARTFRGQFTLSQSTELSIEGYRVTDLGNGWRLHHCRALPYARLRTARGEFAGIVLGIAVDGEGQLVTDGSTLTSSFEEFATDAAGRYVLIDADGAVYADPTGSMGVVYDAGTRTVASTPLMCVNRPLIDPPRFDPDAIQAGRGSYALGFTRDAYVRGVVPNHRLDLTTFALTRFWPRPDATFPTDAPEETVAAMGKRLSDVIGAIALGHPTLLPLSGGRDSRNLAAAAKPHLPHIAHSYTFVYNWQSQIDAEVAKQIADTLGLSHQTYASYSGSARERDTLPRAARIRQKLAFRLAGGYVGDPNNDVLDGLARKLPKGVVLRGNVMELLKANHWKRGLAHDAADPDGHDADYATERLAIFPDGGAQTVATFKPDYLAWHATLPDAAKRVAYDFAFMESLLPGWQPKFYGYTRNFLVNPFSDRALIKGCMCLPVAERQANIYNDALLAYLAPELVPIPFTPDIKVARFAAA